MKLSVVIPCYTEESTIVELLKAVREGLIQDLEVIVIDDASTDGGRLRLQSEARPLIDKLLFHEVGISYYGRTYKQGKKIGWRDDFRAINAVFKYSCFS